LGVVFATDTGEVRTGALGAEQVTFDGSSFEKGLAQVLSMSGGTTVVRMPPMKKMPSAAATANPKLVSAFCNMRSPVRPPELSFPRVPSP
jgi:hypothetical protein